MYFAFHIHLKILDSHQMDVKSLIQGMLSPTKDDLCAVMLATNANGACQGQREEIEIGDRQVNRMRKGGGACGSFVERIPKHFRMSHSG